MTVTSEISRVDPPYAGNGVTTVFPYTFKIFAAGDLRVILTDPDGVETTLVLGVDYTVSGAGSAAGGNVTTTVAPATDYTLSIERVLAPTQPVDLRNQGPFLAEVVERVADRLTMLVQQALAESGSALRLPKGEAATDLTTLLPPLADRKGMALGFDLTTGAPGAYGPLSGATVSAAMIAVVQAATQQIARDLLAGGVTANRVLRGDGTHVNLGQILLADFANMTDARLLGRSAGSAGIPQELTVGDGLALAGGSLSASLGFFGRIFNGTAVAHTGAGTLTVDRMNTVNLTSADATLALPPAAANAGKVVGVKVLSTNTKCATIDGDTTETIDGKTTLTMHKNGLLLIVSDGTGWYSLIRNLAPDVRVFANTTVGQSIDADTENISYSGEITDTHAAWATNTFTVPVDGVYSFAFARAFTTAATRYAAVVLNNDSQTAIGSSFGTNKLFGSGSARFLAGQAVTFRSLSNGGTGDTDSTYNTVWIQRIGDYP